jgi:MFS transporter, CP family, cyanate transporter
VTKAGSGAALLALFFAGLTFRPQIVGAGPLFPLIQDDLDVSHAVIGLLGTIPVLCMGLLAPPAAYVVRRLGTRAGIGLSIVLVGVFGLVRAVAPGIVLVVLLTLGVGVGMGLGGAIVPVAVKERYAQRPGFATGIYGTGIQGGSALSAAAAVPLAHGLDGWRSSLLVFSAVTCVLAAGWFLLMRGEPAHAPPLERPPMLPWRRPIAWLLVVVFGLMACTYYGLANWLADSYVERGWSDSRAGWMFAVLNLTSIPGALLIPWLSDHIGSRRPWLVGTAAVYALSSLGFVQLPGAVWLWAVIGGVASGAMFALVLTLPVDLERDARTVGAMVGMMLGLGYVIGATSPLLLGAVRDATGSFTGSLWLVVGFSALLTVTVACLPQTRRRPGAVTTS